MLARIVNYNWKMPTSREMAHLLGIKPLQVRELLKRGYLKRARKPGQIELPPRSALQWLKLMLLPLPSRPLFTLAEIMELSGLSSKLLRKIILAWNIPLHYDPAFGELMSPSSLIELINVLHGLKEPVRFDRVVLLNWMQGMMPRDRYVRPKLPYSKLIDQEIKRIAALAEPERTIASQRFYKAYLDARIVSDAIDWRKQPPRSIDKQIPRTGAIRESRERRRAEVREERANRANQVGDISQSLHSSPPLPPLETTEPSLPPPPESEPNGEPR
jgi:hypothetical protein